MLTPASFKALGINGDADVPLRGKIERNADGDIESLLTMVDGRIVYGAGPCAALEERRPPH